MSSDRVIDRDTESKSSNSTTRKKPGRPATKKTS